MLVISKQPGPLTPDESRLASSWTLARTWWMPMPTLLRCAVQAWAIDRNDGNGLAEAFI